MSEQVTDSERISTLESEVRNLWDAVTALSTRLMEATGAEEIIRRARAEESLRE